MPSLVEANASLDTTQVGVCDPNGRVDQGGHQLNVCETNNNEPTTPRSIVGSFVNLTLSPCPLTRSKLIQVSMNTWRNT